MNFEKIVYNHKDEIVKTFQELLQIPSVLDESDASVVLLLETISEKH